MTHEVTLNTVFYGGYDDEHKIIEKFVARTKSESRPIQKQIVELLTHRKFSKTSTIASIASTKRSVPTLTPIESRALVCWKPERHDRPGVFFFQDLEGLKQPVAVWDLAVREACRRTMMIADNLRNPAPR